MAERTAARAPYNFVPFSSKVLLRYQNEADLPHHNVIDPELKTGEIHVTMTADTPVFVSDGSAQNKEKTELHFFCAPNGRYALPGSTIRGMVRENMQILGFGVIHPGEDFENIQIFFREMAAAKDSTGKELKDYYHAALGVTTSRSTSGKAVSAPRSVQAGYLRRQGDGYVIQPVQGKYLRVSWKHPDVGNLGNEFAKTMKIMYSVAGDRVEHIRVSDRPIPGMEQGVLLLTGKPVGSKPNSLYVFPKADEAAVPVEISPEDALSYQEDLETRKNSLKAYYDPDFWAMPSYGEEKPVFYTRYEGHVYFGMSLFLRIGHRHALSDGLPQRQRDALRKNPSALDYPHAILGFAEKTRAYRSRVSFGDFEAVGNPREGTPYPAVLMQPKPSFYPGYVVDGKNYSEDDFQLRGYKQYWLKEVGTPPAGKVNVMGALRPLPKGTCFRGVIRFQNLHADELGLLLWCLRLDSGCFQSVGMGKPYGFGRMQLKIDALLEYDYNRMYGPQNLCGNVAEDKTDAVAQYIDMYDSYAAEKFYMKHPKKKPSIRSLDEIKDFFYLRSSIQTEDACSYMNLPEHRNTGVLPSTASFREQGESAAVQNHGSKSNGKQADSLDEWKAQLRAKHNTRW